jgi:hypothetical protein
MWPAQPAAQAQLTRSHRLTAPRVTDAELRGFERMLAAADATALAREAQRARDRKRERAQLRAEESEEADAEEAASASAHFDALLEVVEAACGATCQLPAESRRERVKWAAGRLASEMRLVKKPRLVEAQPFVRELASELLARIDSHAHAHANG